MAKIEFEVTYMTTVCSACHVKLPHIRNVLTEACQHLPDAEWSEKALKTRDELLEFAKFHDVCELPLPIVLVNGRLFVAGRIPLLQETLEAARTAMSEGSVERQP